MKMHAASLGSEILGHEVDASPTGDVNADCVIRDACIPARTTPFQRTLSLANTPAGGRSPLLPGAPRRKTSVSQCVSDGARPGSPPRKIGADRMNLTAG